MKNISLITLPEITRGRLDRITVFSDFLELAAIQISNKVDPVHYKERDERAKIISERYTETEHVEMDRYFEELFRQIKNNIDAGICEDILSRIFEESGFGRQGQNQSPPGLARLLAQISMGDNLKIPEKGFIELDEPTCGSGSLILGFAEAMTGKNLNYCEQLVVRATDTDPKCVCMAYIQLSLYGIPAVVIHGETLSLKEYTRWYTPTYIFGNWVWKCPIGFTDAKNTDDEMLKRMTDPLYNAIRHSMESSNIKEGKM